MALAATPTHPVQLIHDLFGNVSIVQSWISISTLQECSLAFHPGSCPTILAIIVHKCKPIFSGTWKWILRSDQDKVKGQSKHATLICLYIQFLIVHPASESKKPCYYIKQEHSSHLSHWQGSLKQFLWKKSSTSKLAFYTHNSNFLLILHKYFK